MVYMRVNVTVGEKAEKMESAVVVKNVSDLCLPGIGSEELVGLYGV